MTTEEALELLGLDWPRSNKLSCPNHSDSDPSLHLYPEDRGFYCFSCNKGGDALDLLAHYTGRPLSEIISEHGVKIGPRGRSRWQQVSDLEKRVLAAGVRFTLAMKELWPSPTHLPWVAQMGDRVDLMFDDLGRVDPETPPFILHGRVRELERFYEAEVARHRAANDTFVTTRRERLQGPELRLALRQDGRRGGGSVRVRLSEPDRGVRLA